MGIAMFFRLLSVSILAFAIITASNVDAATLESAPFSFGFGVTAAGTNPNVWSTTENAANNSATTQGDFQLIPTVLGDRISSRGVTFTNRTLGGLESNHSGYQNNYAVTLDAAYTGPTPPNAAPNPNYQLSINLTQLNLHAAPFRAQTEATANNQVGDTVGTVGFVESTAGNAQAQTQVPILRNQSGNSTLSGGGEPLDYTQVLWDPADFNSSGTTQQRVFNISIPTFVAGDANTFISLEGTEVFATVVLTYDAIAGLPGDYNANGVVDAPDYVVWRKNFGTAGPQGDGTGPTLDGIPDGVVDDFDHAFWRQNFGNGSPGSGSRLGAGAIPEPATWIMVVVALGGAFSVIHQRSRRALKFLSGTFEHTQLLPNQSKRLG